MAGFPGESATAEGSAFSLGSLHVPTCRAGWPVIAGHCPQTGFRVAPWPICPGQSGKPGVADRVATTRHYRLIAPTAAVTSLFFGALWFAAMSIISFFVSLTGGFAFPASIFFLSASSSSAFAAAAFCVASFRRSYFSCLLASMFLHSAGICRSFQCRAERLEYHCK